MCIIYCIGLYCTVLAVFIYIFMLNLLYWLIIYFYLRVKVFDITVTETDACMGYRQNSKICIIIA